MIIGEFRVVYRRWSYMYMDLGQGLWRTRTYYTKSVEVVDSNWLFGWWWMSSLLIFAVCDCVISDFLIIWKRIVNSFYWCTSAGEEYSLWWLGGLLVFGFVYCVVGDLFLFLISVIRNLRWLVEEFWGMTMFMTSNVFFMLALIMFALLLISMNLLMLTQGEFGMLFWLMEFSDSLSMPLDVEFSDDWFLISLLVSIITLSPGLVPSDRLSVLMIGVVDLFRVEQPGICVNWISVAVVLWFWPVTWVLLQ